MKQLIQIVFLALPAFLAGQAIQVDDIREVSELPDALNESSGLILLEDGTLVSHNDSGGEPELLVFRPGSKELIRKIRIHGAKNRDWEEMTSDNEFIYIGDFGNNNGARKDLVIYIVRKDDLKLKTAQTVGEIHFSYPEQTSFFPSFAHNFDCEAMVVHDGLIYLFTKNRKDGKSNIYTIPCKPGEYEASFKAELNTKGLITGAALSPDERMIACIGYTFLGANRFHPFVYVITGYDDFILWQGKQLRFDLPVVKQTEAICFRDGTTVYFTEEEENNQTGNLYELDLKPYLQKE